MDYIIFEYYSVYEKIPTKVIENEQNRSTIFWIGREPPINILNAYTNFYYIPEPEYISYGIRPELVRFTCFPTNSSTTVIHNDNTYIIEWHKYYHYGALKLEAKRSNIRTIPFKPHEFKPIIYQPVGEFVELCNKFYLIPGFLPSNKLLKPKQLEIDEWVSTPGVCLHTLQITAEGLLGFKERRELFFQPKETLLIVGSNQAGKSSWVDVWCFALWGKTSRVRPKGILRTNQQFGWVEVLFQDSTGRKGRIRREISRVGGPLSENVKTNLIISEFINHRWIPWIPPAKKNDLQEALNEWIGPWNTVQETAVISMDMQEQIIRRTPREWQKILSHWLLLGRQLEDVQENQTEEEKLTQFADLTRRILQFMENQEVEQEQEIAQEQETSDYDSITLKELQKFYRILQKIGITFHQNNTELSLRELEHELRKASQPEKSSSLSHKIDTTPRKPTEEPKFTNIKQEIREIVDANPSFYGKQCKLLEIHMNEILEKFGFRFYLHWGNQFQFRFTSNRALSHIDSELKQGCRFEKIIFTEIIRMMTRFIFHHAGLPVWETTWIDESWDGTDMDNIRKLVKYFSRVSKQTVIISHQSELKKLLGNILSIS